MNKCKCLIIRICQKYINFHFAMPVDRRSCKGFRSCNGYRHKFPLWRGLGGGFLLNGFLVNLWADSKFIKTGVPVLSS